MSKYTDLTKAIMSFFASAAWTAEEIPAFPNNFVGDVSGNTYLRLSVLPSQEGINPLSVEGLLQVEIFVPSGDGVSEYTRIADRLDSHLVTKSVQSSNGAFTQFQRSTLSVTGQDRDNPALYRAIYSIPFQHYGV